jgi:predicted TIM-barrel fold metal-dependent hydrolase
MAYLPAPVGLTQYRQMLRTLGLSRAVVVQPTVYADNSPTAEVLREVAGQWRGIAVLKSEIDNAGLKRLDNIGFRGVRMHPGRMSNLDSLATISARIADLGWHLQLHIDGGKLADILPLLHDLPTEVVIDHFGRIALDRGLESHEFGALLRYLAKGRSWLKLSAANRFSDPRPPYPRLIPFARRLIEEFPDRLVWGSDWPHSAFYGVMPNDADLLDLLSLWADDETARRRILVDNPERLYGFH